MSDSTAPRFGSSFAPARAAGQIGGAWPALVLVGLFFVVPVVALLLRSVTEPELGLQNYATLLADGTYLRVLLST